ncbi:sperm-associated microtubule inner protein 4 [Tiliqua scincoides]|uniref:sperm-associated microtubule inner protein 4 n=1 Tax=Tiliqua scincoides TaxID=71010 RepID=UPI003461A1A0
MEVHPRLSFYNDVPDGTALVTQTLESTRDLTPLHIPPGPPISSDRYEELRDTFQLLKPVLKAGQEHGGSEPLLPETHRIYEPPYAFHHKHQYYGSDRDAPLRYAGPPKYRSPGTQSTLLVECRYRPFHPYVHVPKINMRAYPHRNQDASTPVDIPTEAERQQLSPVAERNYQKYYAKDSAVGAPKSTSKPPELNISARAANMLANVKKALWLSTYKRDYTGTGSMNPLLLDDYDAKVIGRATGELGKDVELRETFPSRMNQVRPLEGRIARFLQGRPPYVTDHQQQGSAEVQMPPIRCKNDTVPRSYSAGMQSSGDMSLGSLQQSPESKSKAERWIEGFLQYQNQPCADYHEESYQDKKLPWNNFRKITDTWKTERLYQRQLAVPPDPKPIPLKPTDSIYYEDLEPSRLNKRIVWHNPISLSKPSSEDYLWSAKPDDQQDHQHTSDLQDIATSSSFPEWIPNCGVAHPQTKLLDIQDAFTKTDTIKRLRELTKGGIRDLRDHDREGKKHKFQGIDARFFH